MFDYARKMKLALTDTVRRTAMKAAAGVVIAVGVGFLLAALWTFLAYHLHWGPLAASGAIGGVFVVIGAIVIVMANKVRHTPPQPSELTDEVKTRVSLAAEQAGEMAKAKAQALVGTAGQTVQGLVDDISYRANAFAETAETKAKTFASTTLTDAAAKVGLTPETVAEVKEVTGKVARTNVAAIGGLIGAFAVGVTLAKTLRGDADESFDDYDYDYDDFDDAY